MDEVTLSIGDQDWSGWTAVAMGRALDQAAGQFELDLVEHCRRASDDLRPLTEHQPCLLSLGEDVVIRGVIDQVAPSYDANTHRISVTGRSLVAQLVDCSCEFQGGALGGMSLAAIARKLAEPFGVEVVDLAGEEEVFPRVQVELGETAHEVLERLARQRGVFLTDDAEGRLVIRRRSTALQGRLCKGGNVLRARGDLDGSQTFSFYEFRGQTEGRDGDSPRVSARVIGRAVDAGVPIHRPMIMLPETQGAAARLQDRAEFEAATRRGRGRQWTYTINGWRRPDGALWAIGEEVEVTDDFMGFEEERLLVVRLRFRFDSGGRIAELTVAPPEGYDLRAEEPEGGRTVAKKEKLTGWDAI